jgi:hypothetical protein
VGGTSAIDTSRRREGQPARGRWLAAACRGAPRSAPVAGEVQAEGPLAGDDRFPTLAVNGGRLDIFSVAGACEHVVQHGPPRRQRHRLRTGHDARLALHRRLQSPQIPGLAGVTAYRHYCPPPRAPVSGELT